MVGAYLGYCVQLWAPQHRRDMDVLESVQPRVRKVLKEKHPPVCREGLGALWFFSSEEKAQGHLINGQIAVGRVQRRQNLAFFAAWCQNQSHWAQNETGEFCSEHQETLFGSEGGCTPAGVGQRGVASTESQPDLRASLGQHQVPSEGIRA